MQGKLRTRYGVLSYEEAGDREQDLIVLIPSGVLPNYDDERSFVFMAAQHYHVLRVSTPGSGRTWDSRGYFDENHFLEQLQELLLPYAAKRIHLIGVSLGGTYSLLLAQRIQVASVTVLGGGTFMNTLYKCILGLVYWPALVSLRCARFFGRIHNIFGYYDFSRTPDRQLLYVFQRWNRVPWLRHTLERTNIPTHLVIGTKDRIVSKRVMEQECQTLTRKRITLIDCEHMYYLDTLAETDYRPIFEFVESVLDERNSAWKALEGTQASVQESAGVTQSSA